MVKNSQSEKWSIRKVVIRKFCMLMLLSEIRPAKICPSEIRPLEKSHGAFYSMQENIINNLREYFATFIAT